MRLFGQCADSPRFSHAIRIGVDDLGNEPAGEKNRVVVLGHRGDASAPSIKGLGHDFDQSRGSNP
jgi:hypothetical protein